MMSYWLLTLSGNFISCVTVQLLTNSERNNNEWSQRMRDYNIAIEHILDVKDADLSKYLAMVEQWNKLTVEYKYP